MSLDYIRNHYKVPAEVGREILYTGDKGKDRKGVIVCDKGNYIGVVFHDSEPEEIMPLHPTWEVKYLEIVKIRKFRKSKTRAKQRYQEFLDADWFSGSFIQWLRLSKAE